ncbi:MAG: glycosyltransferase family 4 protein [Thermoplasmata archaeon]
MSGKKKVLMLLSNPFRPDPRVRKEAKSLLEAGHSVAIVAWDRLGSSPRKENNEGIEVLRAGPRSAFDSMLPIIATLPIFYLNAFRLSFKTKPDVIHCHDFDTLPLGLIMGRLKGAKVIYDSHESYPDMIAGSVPGCISAFVSFLESRMVRHVDAVIAPSPTIIRKFKKMGARRLVTVMNCTELLPPPSEVEIKELRGKLANPGETLVIYIGTLEKIRGLEQTVRAFHKYSNGEFKLIMGGFGPIESQLKDLCQKSKDVTFIGPVKSENMRLYNHASDVMLMLSDHKNIQTKYGLANKIFESMSAGKPVIVSRRTLHEKIVLGAGTGIAIRYFDGKALFKALRRLRDDRELYTRISENGRRAARNTYNWDVMAARLKKLYQTL